MHLPNVLSGQVYGTVDWVTTDGREFGMFMKTSERPAFRCVLRGSEVERMLANNTVQKGMVVTAFGEFFARCLIRQSDNTPMPELVCEAARVVPEPPAQARFRGSVGAFLKGVVMHWDPATLQLKTFFNYKQPGMPERVTCSIHMKSWVDGMTPEGLQSFKASIRNGRVFTTAAMVEISSYRSKEGLLVPILQLLPTNFALHG